MSSEERFSIDRDELFTGPVAEALARQRAARGRPVVPETPVTPLRRVLLSSLFYLPLAGLVGAVVAWVLLEPSFDDVPMIGGEVVIVNTDPFDSPHGFVSLTVGHTEVVLSEDADLEKGGDGQAAYSSIHAIAPGDHIEVVGAPLGHDRIQAVSIRPATVERANETGDEMPPEIPIAAILLFPATACFVAFMLNLAEGLAARNYLRLLERAFLGTLLATLFSFLAYIPAGLFMTIADKIAFAGYHGDDVPTVHSLTMWQFIGHTVGRSLAWASIGAALGVGMNLVRSTGAQLRNSVLGGTLGGAMGGLFFDPIGRFFQSASLFEGGDVSRAIGLCAVGVSIGLFVALTERLAREAWVVVRSGPLAGKSFVLFRTPTRLGSSPQSDIYLFKDADIDPEHAAIHRVGQVYEIEDLTSRTGTWIGRQQVRRTRLRSGDQVTLGGTIVEFEERAKRAGTPGA